ncbi:nucleoside triphosphate pyrophosphohydrolase [Natronosalvus caseinilyticus]|uniref:nucleoside triphosphate pyrophosphohydrolase n=1 Tax=Natronosalvus caseinilyticus TaxID=2953747 RepID=UPI0028A92583|nr:nucleoside triphosphate pyrophosphohydrolase [Natronosalvus caseinilyticus]
MPRIYDKLVRDEIPTIVEANDERPITHVADDEEYDRRLLAKLEEECAEYREDRSLDELADVLEVVRACCVHEGWSTEELEERRREKAAERGGFEAGIVLEAVVERHSQSTPDENREL